MHGTISWTWTTERRNTVRRQWAAGLTAGNIADELGCSRNAVIGLIHRNRWKAPQTKTVQRYLTPERRDLIIDMNREGWNNAKIAQELDCDRGTVRRHLSQRGLASNRTVQRERFSVLTGQRLVKPKPEPKPKSSFATVHHRPDVSLRNRNAEPICEPDPVKRSEVSTKAFGESCGLLDLQRTSCHWPVTDDGPHLFCNAMAVPGLPYCPAHSRIAYNVTPKAIRAPSARVASLGFGGSRVLPPDWGL